jgi:hypothetical protein
MGILSSLGSLWPSTEGSTSESSEQFPFVARNVNGMGDRIIIAKDESQAAMVVAANHGVGATNCIERATSEDITKANPSTVVQDLTNVQLGVRDEIWQSSETVSDQGSFRNYTVAHTLDPRPTDAAQATNETVFASGDVSGVEVTIPALASQCKTNIDPQHTDGNADLAAIEEALTCDLTQAGTNLATVRADVDSIGAIAVINLRLRGQDLSEAQSRIQAIADADKFARGEWPGQQPLPSRENPWPAQNAAANDSRELAAISAAISDFKAPMDQRVALMEEWLLTGKEPSDYFSKVEADRMDMITALDDGRINATTTPDGKIAIVESTHQAATLVGYSLAPVVVAFNPEFSVRGGEPHAKFTVCQYQSGFVDMNAVTTELNALDTATTEKSTWGGQPNIKGSPQGIASSLDIPTVVGVVRKNLVEEASNPVLQDEVTTEQSLAAEKRNTEFSALFDSQSFVDGYVSRQTEAQNVAMAALNRKIDTEAKRKMSIVIDEIACQVLGVSTVEEGRAQKKEWGKALKTAKQQLEQDGVSVDGSTIPFDQWKDAVLMEVKQDFEAETAKLQQELSEAETTSRSGLQSIADAFTNSLSDSGFQQVLDQWGESPSLDGSIQHAGLVHFIEYRSDKKKDRLEKVPEAFSPDGFTSYTDRIMSFVGNPKAENILEFVHLSDTNGKERLLIMTRDNQYISAFRYSTDESWRIITHIPDMRPKVWQKTKSTMQSADTQSKYHNKLEGEISVVESFEGD